MVSGAFMCDSRYNSQVLLDTKASRVMDSGGTDRILKAHDEWGNDKSLEICWTTTTVKMPL
jgi:hypothetical protein